MNARDEARKPPRAPWGAFPLSELTVLGAIALALYGFLDWGRPGAGWAVGAAACLGSLAGLEVAIREHFTGYRAHTTLLAATAAVAVLSASELGTRSLFLSLALGLTVFLATDLLLRGTFEQRRRSSGEPGREA